MICVYDIGNTAYTKNGDAVLAPTSAKVHMVAAGQYDLTMEHPIDPWGKWTHLQPEAVIRAPIPKEIIKNAFSGIEADVYKTTSAAPLRESPSEPSAITYSEWSSSGSYSVGSKVSVSGWSHRNYQCVYWDGTSGETQVPPYASDWWRAIADTSSGAQVLVNLKSGAELYYVSGPTNGWYKMATPYSLEGYIKATQVTYDRHLTPSETQDRVITTQLFRIKKVAVDTKNMKVSVTAEHISYDLNGVLLNNLTISRKEPAEAIYMIEDAFMISYPGTIATNITSGGDKTYSAELNGKCGMYALLDPDKGVVAQFDAKFQRDNWDLFIMGRETQYGSDYRIIYEKNMLGVNWTKNSDQLITRIVPVAKDEDGSDLFLSGTKWVDSSHINDYPRKRMERLRVNGQVGKDDGTETATNWTKAALRTEMQNQAQARYTVDKCDLIKHEITVDFLMLGDTDEYKQLKALQQIHLYDVVEMVDPRISLSATVSVVEIEYDAVNERITALKLSNIEGENLRNVTGFNVLNNSITDEKLTDGTQDMIVETATGESNKYTDSQLSYVKSWVSANFQPKS